MGILSAVIGVVFLVYLLLRISRMLGGSNRSMTTEEVSNVPEPLPELTPSELQALLSSMPTAWVTYEGTTPPLRLKVRGLTNELYRRFVRAHVDAIGQENMDSLPQQEKVKVMTEALPSINAHAYVVEWEGGHYPNGRALPATPDNLATLMRKDEMLRNFISEEAGRIGPEW